MGGNQAFEGLSSREHLPLTPRGVTAVQSIVAQPVAEVLDSLHCDGLSRVAGVEVNGMLLMSQKCTLFFFGGTCWSSHLRDHSALSAPHKAQHTLQKEWTS